MQSSYLGYSEAQNRFAIHFSSPFAFNLRQSVARHSTNGFISIWLRWKMNEAVEKHFQWIRFVRCDLQQITFHRYFRHETSRVLLERETHPTMSSLGSTRVSSRWNPIKSSANQVSVSFLSFVTSISRSAMCGGVCLPYNLFNQRLSHRFLRNNLLMKLRRINHRTFCWEDDDAVKHGRSFEDGDLLRRLIAFRVAAINNLLNRLLDCFNCKMCLMITGALFKC